MIVQCPHCSDRYRVNEQNIPSTGGRIRCPSCSSTFVVYPTSAQQQQQPAAPSYDAEKTSVATNISDLMGSFGGGGNFGGGAPSGGGQEDEGATEVISGDSLPNFAGGLFGGGAPAQQQEEDGTVEMENPLMLAGIGNFNQQQNAAGGGGEDIYAATEIVSADEAAAMLGDVPGSDRTEIVDPSMVDGGHTEIVDPAQVAYNSGPQNPAPPAFGGGAPPQFGGGQGSGGFQAAQPAGGGFGQNGFGGGQPAQHAQTPEQAQPTPPAPAAGGPDPNHNGPWKLKTNFGLTYEFPDTKGLKGWMASRDDFDGYTLSAGGDAFFPLDAFPQISGNLPAGGAPGNNAKAGGFGNQAGGMNQGGGFGGQQGGMNQGGGFGGGMNQGGFGGQGAAGGQGTGQQRTNRPKHNTMPPQPINMTSNELPSRDAKWNKVLWLLFIVLFVGCGLLAVQIMGVYDFKALLGISKPPIEKTEPIANTPPKEDKGANATTPDGDGGGDTSAAPKLSAEQAAEVEGLVEEARSEIKGNKLASAKTKLEIAKSIDPNRFDVYDLLAQVYEQTGEDDKAKAMRMEVQALRAKSNTGETEESPE